jgi:thiol-disulfide isomerase/thioredoxin
MMTQPSVDLIRSRRAFALTMLALAALAGFLYVKSRDREQKKPVNPACLSSQPLAASLSALATGEMRAFAPTESSEPMPGLAFNGADGAPTSLEAFKGRTVLLNLWATWCLPCREEMTKLDALQMKMGSEHFEVVAINVDTSRPDRPKAFLNEIGAKALKFYADPKGEVFFQLKQTDGLLGLPTTFLIDAAGCKLGALTGPAAWDSPAAMALVARATERAP